eukprot:403361295
MKLMVAEQIKDKIIEATKQQKINTEVLEGEIRDFESQEQYILLKLQEKEQMLVELQNELEQLVDDKPIQQALINRKERREKSKSISINQNSSLINGSSIMMDNSLIISSGQSGLGGIQVGHCDLDSLTTKYDTMDRNTIDYSQPPQIISRDVGDKNNSQLYIDTTNISRQLFQDKTTVSYCETTPLKKKSKVSMNDSLIIATLQNDENKNQLNLNSHINYGIVRSRETKTPVYSQQNTIQKLRDKYSTGTSSLNTTILTNNERTQFIKNHDKRVRAKSINKINFSFVTNNQEQFVSF